MNMVLLWTAVGFFIVGMVVLGLGILKLGLARQATRDLAGHWSWRFGLSSENGAPVITLSLYGNDKAHQVMFAAREFEMVKDHQKRIVWYCQTGSGPFRQKFFQFVFTSLPYRKVVPADGG